MTHQPPELPERRKQMRREEDREKFFTLPQTLVICAFVAALASLAGWTLNLEIRKADRSEIIGASYRPALDARLSNIETDVREIRNRLDDLAGRGNGR